MSTTVYTCVYQRVVCVWHYDQGNGLTLCNRKIEADGTFVTEQEAREMLGRAHKAKVSCPACLGEVLKQAKKPAAEEVTVTRLWQADGQSSRGYLRIFKGRVTTDQILDFYVAMFEQNRAAQGEIHAQFWSESIAALNDPQARVRAQNVIGKGHTTTSFYGWMLGVDVVSVIDLS